MPTEPHPTDKQQKQFRLLFRMRLLFAIHALSFALAFVMVFAFMGIDSVTPTIAIVFAFWTALVALHAVVYYFIAEKIAPKQ